MANYSIREFHGNIDKWINAVESGLTDCIEIFGGKVQEALVKGFQLIREDSEETGR